MIKSITMTYDQVARILERHINTEVLRAPHHVTSVDPFDWDGSDQHQFSISLDPLPAAEEEEDVYLAPIPLDAEQSAALKVLFGDRNGNGNHGHATAVTTVTAVTPVTPLPADRPKTGPAAKLPAEVHVKVLKLYDAGRTQVQIAEQLDLAQSTVNRIIADNRGLGYAKRQREAEQARRRIALEPADHAEISRLTESGIPIDEIAAELNIDRKAIVRYLTGADADPVTAPQEATQARPAEAAKSARRYLTDEDRARILSLSAAGVIVREIAAEVGCSEATVYDVRKAARADQFATEAQAGDA